MDARNESKPGTNRTTVQRKSDREVVVTRTFDAPARLVFEAWTKPALFKQWWVPRSMGMDARAEILGSPLGSDVLSLRTRPKSLCRLIINSH